jgi:hypothetical protein
VTAELVVDTLACDPGGDLPRTCRKLDAPSVLAVAVSVAGVGTVAGAFARVDSVLLARLGDDEVQVRGTACEAHIVEDGQVLGERAHVEFVKLVGIGVCGGWF